MANSTGPCTVIAVDDDPQALRQLCQLLTPPLKVLTTPDPKKAQEWLEKDRSVGIIIVEQVLRSGLGIDLLATCKEIRPEVRRILIARYSDMSTIVQGLHNGAIQRTISKPILPRDLASALGNAAIRASA